MQIVTNGDAPQENDANNNSEDDANPDISGDEELNDGPSRNRRQEVMYVEVPDVGEGPSTRQFELEDANGEDQPSGFTVQRGQRKAKRPKKKLKAEDSDEDDEQILGGFNNGPQRPDSANDTCARCSAKFANLSKNVSALCPACLKMSTVKAKPRASKKQIKVVHKTSLLDDMNKSVLPLQDLCIKLVCQYVDQIEDEGSLGAISAQSREKISRIMSKHRQLTDKTMNLLFDATNESLKLYDCAKITEDAFRTIALFNPNLYELELCQCGQMTDEVINVFAQHLAELRSIKLVGAFLVHDDAFARFIRSKPNLQSVKLSYSQKLGSQTLEALSELPHLRELVLNQCTRVQDSDLLNLGSIPAMEVLDLSDCVNISDDGVIPLLEKWSHSLKGLKMDGCCKLTDAVLETIGSTCASRFKELSLSRLVEITDEGLARLSDKLRSLHYLKLERLQTLESESIASVACQPHLKYLSLNGDIRVSLPDLFKIIDSVDDLEELDVSWIQEFDDSAMDKLMEKHQNLKVLRIWGCVRLTEITVKLWSRDRPGLKIIGSPHKM